MLSLHRTFVLLLASGVLLLPGPSCEGEDWPGPPPDAAPLERVGGDGGPGDGAGEDSGTATLPTIDGGDGAIGPSGPSRLAPGPWPAIEPLAVPGDAELPMPGAPAQKPCETPACRACASAPTVELGAQAVVIHDATMGSGRFEGGCVKGRPASSPLAPERIYRLRLTRTARFRADTAGTSFDTVLYLRRNCDDGQELACSDDETGSYQAAIEVVLEAGDHYLFIDGYGPIDSGRFILTLALHE